MVVYYRNDGCGLCSSLFCVIVRLSIDKPDIMYADIYHPNYKCHWSDIFDNPVSEGQKKHVVNSNPHEIYSNTNKPQYSIEIIKKWHNAYKQYIRPKFLIDNFLQQYPIKESIVVYFRGTDKCHEVRRVQYDEYLPHIPSTGPIYVQSDEYKFVEFIMQKYPDRAYIIKEFTQNTTGNSMHINSTVKDAIEISQITQLMACGLHFIYNISNVSLCSLIIRGNLNNCKCIH